MLFSFLTLFLMPIRVLKMEYIAEFWLANWFLAPIFFIIILTINLFFAFNWQIIKHTEKGNWDGIITILEKRIYEKKIITYTNVKLLVHSYFLLGKELKIKNLEKYVKDKKTAIYNKTFLMFCCANLISYSNSYLKTYLAEAVDNKALKGMNWILMNYAFVLISGKEFDKALMALKKIEKDKKNRVLYLTKLYFLYVASHQEDRENIALLKENFTKKINIKKFEKEFEMEKGDIHILFLSKIINQAKEWAYGQPSEANSPSNKEAS